MPATWDENAYDEAENPPLAEVTPSDEELLKEIRDTYTDFNTRWQDSRDEHNLDLRYICGDPWDPADKRAREQAGRPCISWDELGQYVNHCVNNVRNNKRGVKVEPRGGGTATNKTAELDQNLIRGIEYRNQGPSVYLTAFQQMTEGSYGYFRIGRRYVSDDLDSLDPTIFNQEITISSIPNPNSVLFDPFCKKPDWSDAKRVFVLDPIPRDEFKRRWPRAQITDFTPEHTVIAKDWIQDKQILTAEYWRVVVSTRKKYELDTEMRQVVDRVPRGVKVRRTRSVEKRNVWQYFTNGVEIIEREEQPGPYIPIIPMIGLERYVDEGGVAVRKIFSLVRLGRDPQMSLAYLVSGEMEEAGLTPKTPYKGFVGQFETDRDAIEQSTKIPRAFLQFDPIPDGSGAVLPLPARESFTPNFQAYEVAKDSCRRAIQAAMGISPLPTAAQRDNQKSGVAIERMDQQQEIGSFHFVDGYDRAVSLGGRVIESYLPVVNDTEREESIRKPDDSHAIVRLNTEQPYQDPSTGEMVQYTMDPDAKHDVSVSTGPSAASQQEAVGKFLDLLLTELPTLPLAPPQAQKILALAIQMKNLGPKGDEIADIISPPDNGQGAQQAQQMQQQMALQGQALQAMQAELQKLQLERAGKVIDNQAKAQIEQMKIEAQVTAAEIQTKAQSTSERLAFVEDMMHKMLDSGHDLGMLAAQQAHEKQQSDAAAAQQRQAATQDQAHQQGMAAQSQGAAAQQAELARQAQPAEPAD
jgi:hypothetical protein